MGIDASLLIWINQGWADPGLDFLFQWVSQRVTFSIPLLLALLYYFTRRFNGDGVSLWLLLLLCVLMGDMLGNLLKAYFSMPRPCYDLFELLRPAGGGSPRQCQAPTTGMPSNHTLNFFAVATFLTYAVRSKPLSLFFVAIAVLVGLSRIYLAKHYPSQVVTGALLGLLFGFVFAWLSLHAFTFGQRILHLHGQTGDQSVPATERAARHIWWPSVLLEPRGSSGLALAMPIVWLPLLLILIAMLVLWLNGLNQTIFHLLNQLGPHTSDKFWANLTLLGDTLVGFALLGLLARRRLDILGAVLIAALFATAWVHVLKPLLDIPRPLGLLGVEQVHVIGQSLRSHSFPSGHTTTAFTLAGVIILRGVHPILALTVLTLAILVGISRAVVGAHWPLDILAGMFGGWFSAVLGVWLAQRWPWRPKRSLYLTLLFFLIGCALALLITRNLGYPQAIALQMVIGLVSLGYLLFVMANVIRDQDACIT